MVETMLYESAKFELQSPPKAISLVAIGLEIVAIVGVAAGLTVLL
jgi:hypothetical protein